VTVDEACHPKCRRGVIGCNGEQQLIGLVGKAGAITRRRNKTTFRIDTDGNDNAVTSFWAIADGSNDSSVRQTTALGEVLLQPFQKRRYRGSSRDFDRSAAGGIAQTHEGEIHIQRYNQQIGEAGGDSRRFARYPRRWDGRQCNEIPKHPSEPDNVRTRVDKHFVGLSSLRPYPTLSHLE